MRKIVFLLSLQIAMGLHAQTPYFQKYSLLKKNETVQVNVMLQSRTGFMWFGTNRGLFVFDGLNEKQFTKKDSLTDENITALAEDSLGRIWIGCRTGKISYYEKGKIKSFDPPEGTSSQPVSDILFDKQGILWFSTYNDGLYYFFGNRLYRIDEQEGMPDIFVYDILEDRKGNIWAGTDGGAVVVSREGSKVKLKTIDYKNGLPDNIVKKLSLAADGTIWMATEDAGMVNYDLQSGKHRFLTKQPWAFGSITDFVEKDNSFWISSLRKGLIVYDKNASQLKWYDAATQEELTQINDLYEDFEGNIWAGTKTNVLRTGGDNLEYIEDFETAQRTNILSLAVDSHDNIWYSTSDGLFERQINANGAIHVTDVLKNSPYHKHRVISLYVDDEDFVWAGLYGEGVLRINPHNGKINVVAEELRNGNILNITGKGNTVWLATLGGASEIVFDHDKLSVKNFTTVDGLSSDYIYQVFIDSQNRVWFSTDGKGVDMLDEKGFHHFERGLSSKVVFGVTEDLNHQIWANVQNDGLYKLEYDLFVPSHIKLRDNNIACLSSDRFGNPVLLNDLGLDILRIKNNTVVSRGEEAGFKNRIGNLNAVAKDRNGYIYIGTDNGIIKYDGEYFNDHVRPRSVIKGFKVLNKNVDMNNALSFKYDQNSITIEYAGLWFQNPASLSFKYKLDNYDLDWIRSHDHNVTYSSLPPGEYVFRLMASDNENFTNAEEAVVKFVIHPPFWKTRVFYVLVIVVVAFLIYSIIRFREKKLQHDKMVLEEKVRARTLEIQRQKEEIQTQNEEIQAQNEEIVSQAEEIQGINENLEMIVKQRTSELEKKNKALEEYAFINAHQLRAPVASILGLIDLLLRAETEEEIKNLTKHLEESAVRLNDVVRSITTAIERGDD